MEQQNGDLKRQKEDLAQQLAAVGEENQQLRNQVADLTAQLTAYREREEEAHRRAEQLRRLFEVQKRLKK